MGGATRNGTWPRAAGVPSEVNNRVRTYRHPGDRWCQNSSDPNNLHGSEYQTAAVQSAAGNLILSEL